MAAAGSPWDGITTRIPNFWGWVILLGLVVLAVAVMWRAAKRWEQRTRRERVMPLRWRLWLHRHPGKGFARLLVDQRKGYGLRGARKTAKRLYPSMRGVRLLPGTAAAIRLGTTPNAPFRPVWAGPETSVLYIAPPRSGKTGEVANQVLDAPGAVLVTSLRSDVVDLTASLRSQAGPVWVFDPEGVLGPTSPWSLVRWSPVHGCENPQIAMFRAAHMVSTAGTGDVSDRSFWENSAARALRALLHAAALGDYTMHDVYRWAMTSDPTPVRTLEAAGDRAAPGWAATLKQFVNLGEEAAATHASLQQTLGNVLDFMAHPAIAAVCGGRAAESGFDVNALLRNDGTLYMLASEGDSSVLIAPIFTALCAEVHARARAYAATLPTRRLDPPLALILDEAPNICPVPLPAWSATVAGHGMRLVAAIQGPSQMREVWGEQGAKTLMNNFTCKVAWGGLSGKEDREELSALAGEADFWREPVNFWTDANGNQHKQRHREWERQPIIRPDELRMLPPRYALVITSVWAPTIVRTRAAWFRRSVKAALRRPLPAARIAATRPEPITEPQPIVDTPAPPAVVSTPEPDPVQVSDVELAKLLDGDVAARAWPQPPQDTPNPGPAAGGGWGPSPGSDGPTPPWSNRPRRPWDRGGNE